MPMTRYYYTATVRERLRCPLFCQRAAARRRGVAAGRAMWTVYASRRPSEGSPGREVQATWLAAAIAVASR
jgi:hypothetical protein